jgi:hypothetical protein
MPSNSGLSLLAVVVIGAMQVQDPAREPLVGASESRGRTFALQGRLNAVAFSADSQLLATADDSGHALGYRHSNVTDRGISNSMNVSHLSGGTAESSGFALPSPAGW